MGARITAVAGGLAAVALLAAAPSANAFGIQPSVQPASAPAGANEKLDITIQIQQPEQDLKDLTIHLPPGLVGNPLAAPQCTAAMLNTDNCPAASAVGAVSNNVMVHLLPVPLTQVVTGSVYNMAPQPGEPARFGIVLRPPNLFRKIILQSPASLRQSDLGLDTVLTGLPNHAETILGNNIPIDINSVSLNLFGTVGGQGFIRLPTSCGEHTVGFDADSYTGGPASAQAKFTTTDCGALPFSPEFEATARPQGPGEPLELSTTISQTIEEAGLEHAQVILPNGITGSNDLLGITCPRPSFEAGTCPPNTIVGSALASSPLQSQPLTGTVALIEPLTPGLPQIGLDLRGPLALKLTGSLALGADGRAITTFAGLPDIPISEFELTFTREPGFVLAGVDLCDSPPLAVEGLFTAHSGAQTAVQAPIALDGCAPERKRKPKAKLKLAALGSDDPRMKLTVRAGSESLRGVKARLPRELAFAGGRAFRRGTDATADGRRLRGRSVRHTKRGLTLRAKGTERFVAKLARGALEPGRKLDRGDHPRLRLKVTDMRGKRTKLKVRGK